MATKKKAGAKSTAKKARKGASKATVNHAEIKQWVESHGGRPARVAGTGDDEDAGLLRIDFPGGAHSLEEISWDAFFQKFDESNLAFLYQEETAQGEESRFSKLVSRDTIKKGEK